MERFVAGTSACGGRSEAVGERSWDYRSEWRAVAACCVEPRVFCGGGEAQSCGRRVHGGVRQHGRDAWAGGGGAAAHGAFPGRGRAAETARSWVLAQSRLLDRRVFHASGAEGAAARHGVERDRAVVFGLSGGLAPVGVRPSPDAGRGVLLHPATRLRRSGHGHRPQRAAEPDRPARHEMLLRASRAVAPRDANRAEVLLLLFLQKKKKAFRHSPCAGPRRTR